MDVKVIAVDGLSVETTEAGAQAIAKLQSDITKLTSDATTVATDHEAAISTLKSDHKTAIDTLNTDHEAAINTLTSDHETAIADKDEKIGELTGQVKDLEGAAMTPEKLDALVADRSTLMGKANSICKDADFSGKSDAEIMRACVETHYGKDSVSDTDSDDVVRGMFKGIKVAKDEFRETMMGRTPPPSNEVSDMNAVIDARNKRLEEAHLQVAGGNS